MIGPFIDDLTFVVVKIDPKRLDVRPTFQRLMELAPESKKTFQKVAEEAAEGVREIQNRSRGNSIYVVASWTAFSPLMPEESGIEVLSDGAVVPPAKEDQEIRLPFVHQKGGVSIIIPDERGRMPTEGRASHPAPRAEFSAAFGVVKEYPVHVLLAPPPHAARTIHEMLPELPKALGGGSSRVLTEGIRWAAVGIDPQNVSARLVIQSDSQEAAAALVAKVRTALGLLRSVPKAHFPVRESFLDKLIEAVTPAVDGDRLVLHIDGDDASARLFAEAAHAVAENLYWAAAERQRLNKMRHLAMAMHNFHGTTGHFPPPKAGRDKKGRPRLSWRVHLLPYLEEVDLYEQFHLDEPWDSPHNKKLIEKMPGVYRTARSKAKAGYTTLLAPVGEDTVLGGTKPVRIADVPDGTSNTILLVEVKDEFAVPWTAPQDYQFDPEAPGKGLQLDEEGRMFPVFADGSVRPISLEGNEDMLLRLFQKSDGQRVDIE